MSRLLWIFIICFSLRSFSQPAIPTPDHIVVLIMENHSYNQIMESKQAPTINMLAKSSHSALFTQSYALAHPSQPNYLILFSGCNQGIKNDNPPGTIPFTSDNLGRQLLDAGKTFISYAEDLPLPGFDGETSGKYVRRHNPAVYWMGNGPNQLPSSVIQPFTSFPTDFQLLPTVSFVIPNNNNNMHDGSISKGDQWINSHLFNYIQWAKTHNSLFILTFDEDDKSLNNRITTLFIGEMVKPGTYSQKIDHITLLRTIEEMYHLPYACDASKALSINDCWDMTVDNHSPDSEKIVQVTPNSSLHNIKIEIFNDSLMGHLKFSLINIYGKKVKEVPVLSPVVTLPTHQLSTGIYIYQLIKDKRTLKREKIIIN